MCALTKEAQKTRTYIKMNANSFSYIHLSILILFYSSIHSLTLLFYVIVLV